MKKHIQMLGIFYIIYGAMGMMAATVVFFLIAGLGFVSGVDTGAPLIWWLPGSLGLIVSSIVALFALPPIIAGWAILTHKEWGRLLGMVISVIAIFEFPLGTVLGIYGLWVLIQDETIAVFNESRRHRPQSVQTTQ